MNIFNKPREAFGVRRIPALWESSAAAQGKSAGIRRTPNASRLSLLLVFAPLFLVLLSSSAQAEPKRVIPGGMLLHAPTTQPTCSKLPTSYELGVCFQLDRRHCVLISNLDEQGGPDLCVGNDAF